MISLLVSARTIYGASNLKKIIFRIADSYIYISVSTKPYYIYVFYHLYFRRVKDVVWGLNSLFSDLTNFEDPLNIEAADHFSNDREGFRSKVREWVNNYAKR